MKENYWGNFEYYLSVDYDNKVLNGWLEGNSFEEVMSVFMERISGDCIFNNNNFQFPVMVRRIQAHAMQPLCVGLTDDDADGVCSCLGKKALWYIRNVEPGAFFYLGLSRRITAEEFYRRCQDNTIAEVLNVVHPKAGEFYLINPGVVFACSPGLDILEISEDSPAADELHNWGVELPEGECLLLDYSISYVDFSPIVPKALEGDVLVSGPEFHVNRVALGSPLRVSCTGNDSFNLYSCISGEFSLQCPDEKGGQLELVIPAGGNVLVPVEVDEYSLVPRKEGTVLLETFIENLDDDDDYYEDRDPDEPDKQDENRIL
ncbi:MAG: hypothetical protein ACI399_04005 [Candidatus Cryptobacteroides sp.]